MAIRRATAGHATWPRWKTLRTWDPPPVHSFHPRNESHAGGARSRRRQRGVLPSRWRNVRFRPKADTIATDPRRSKCIRQVLVHQGLIKADSAMDASSGAVAPETPRAPTIRPCLMMSTPPATASTSSENKRTVRRPWTRRSNSAVDTRSRAEVRAFCCANLMEA